MKRVPYVNPVWDGYFADPFVYRVGDRYFAVGTGASDADGVARTSAFDVLTSPNLVSWEHVGRALVRPSLADGDTFWAPEVAQRGDRFYLYYSVGHADRAHRLRVAVSTRPEGPFDEMGALTELDEAPFAIDPHPFQDVDGRDYLFYARDFLDDDGGHARPGTAIVVQPLEDMTRLVGPPRTVLRARWDWQRFARDRPMYGGVYDWHTLEGPCVVRRGAHYYCMYSAGCWQTAGYGVDYAIARDVLGPYRDDSTAEGPRLLRGVAGHVVGPGHHSVVRGPDDETDFLCYHAWDTSMTARRLCIDPLVVIGDGLRCDGPSWTKRTLLTRD